MTSDLGIKKAFEGGENSSRKDKNSALAGQEVTDDQNPDCFVIVYAVDDKESFSKSLVLFRF